MKKLITSLVMMASISFSASSAFITNSDFSSLTISGGAALLTSNESVLFDGITDFNPTQSQTVFEANNGVDVSDTPITISGTFNGLFDILSLAIADDWGSITQQEVSELSITFFDASGNSLFSQLFTSINDNSFDIQSLANGLSILSANGFEIVISGAENSNDIEIREFLFEAIASIETVAEPISAPATTAIFLLAAFGFVAARRK